MLMSNIVDESKLKKVQKETLAEIAKTVGKTAGPYGSTTMILHDEAYTEYSKDGHKVLSNIQYFKPLERAVHDELLNITEYVVKHVGDGTTSAVQLSSIVFNRLEEYMQSNPDMPKHCVIEAMENVVTAISDIIKRNGWDITPDSIYDICMISTNGNKSISNDIKTIYEKVGNNAYIQINTSNSQNTILKSFEGIFIDKGFPSAAFINRKDGTSVINNPRIYYFEDNVDTPDMINKFMSIILNNIYMPYSNKRLDECIPTVILANSISQDIKQQLADIERILYSFDEGHNTDLKPPLCIVTGINSNDNIQDVTMLCGCPLIKKFINPDVEQQAIADGNAPTKENVFEWYGTAEQVIVDSNTTRFINPDKMFEKDIKPDANGCRVTSEVYNGLVNHLKAELKAAEEMDNDINMVGSIRRQLNHLETNFVEYYIGGIAATDRNNMKDLVEDAVLNCRSAAVNGVGYGCNFMGLMASSNITDILENKLERDIADIIHNSYQDLILSIYKTAYGPEDAEKAYAASVDAERPMNLRTKKIDDSVLCSLDTDIVVLQAVSKIVSIMVLSNQALVQEPTRNVYLNIEDK